MKSKQLLITSTISLVLLAAGLSVWFLLLSSRQTEPSETPPDPFASVKKYIPLLKNDLEPYDMEEYSTVLAALMQQESRGKGGDPMQASESEGLAPNTIKDPKQSIETGVQYFHRVLVYGTEKGVDLPAIIQSYNMGIGYIDFVAAHGGKNSEELAKEFSLQEVQKYPAIYTCSGDTHNFRYPYCYGDFTYSLKVAENVIPLAVEEPI